MDRITLYKEVRPDISIRMELYFTDQGQLLFDGQDIGKAVEAYWGDSDYEYTYTIEPPEVEKLFSLLNIPGRDRKTLLQELKNRFEGNGAYSEFGKFLKENNIKYSGSTWI